ncbi:MAG: hypothetical protein AABX30_00510 [Nanoarchaeota archaeon]
MLNKRGQIAIFIIIAVVLVAGVAGYFLFRDKFKVSEIPRDMVPIYNSFTSCVQGNMQYGADILGSQAGYIYLPAFEQGSGYMPFSSQLNFLGNPIPYWYYISGNNIQREQVPSLSNMEADMGKYLEEKIASCRFDGYIDKGFIITIGEPDADVSIKDDSIDLDLTMNFEIEKGDEKAKIETHRISYNTRLGALYKDAKKVYNYEQKNLFLELYAVDFLRLYAPVDGVEISCSPKTWKSDEVVSELQNAIEVNTMALKTNGKAKDYYSVDISGVSSNVRFLNSKQWPYTFEITPSEGNILISKPVGNQPGLGTLGFCYVPYHFVYDVKYPVLIQVYSLGSQGAEEVFQFPMAVIIDNNNPRKSLEGSAVDMSLPQLCEYKNNKINVNVYDLTLSPIDKVRVSFECFGTKCDLGESENGKLEADAPQCVNGFVIAQAEGYKDAKYQVESISENSVDMFMNKIKELNVGLNIDGRPYTNEAIISFISEDYSESIIYPEQKKIKLTQGQYSVQVYTYKNSSLKIAATKYEQCVDVPSSGLGGIFGFTKEKCFDVEMPEQIISNALSGGGKQEYYLDESELNSASIVEINAPSIGIPKTIDELQSNYILFEENNLDIYFK